MGLSYKIMSTFNPGKGKEGKKIWFPKLTGTSQMSLREISHMIEKRTTASSADVYLVLKSLVDLIPEVLSDGHTVKLDGLGIFRLHAKVETSESPDNINVKNIKEVRLNFQPDVDIKRTLQTAHIQKEK